MNILLINHYAGSPTHGMEYRPYYFAREWARLGHRVTIVAASYSHLRLVNPSCRLFSCAETHEGVRYLWFWTPAYCGNGIRRVVNMAVFLLQLLMRRRRLAEAGRDGAVIASSTYPLDVVPAWAIATNAHAHLTYELHDLWPLSPIELGGMSPRHPFIRVMQWAEDFACRHVASVVSLLSLAEPHLRDHGLPSGKFHYVPNGINVEEWGKSIAAMPAQHSEVMARLKSQHRFLIGYTGSHGVANALAVLLRAAALLSSHPVSFVLIGKGPEKASLQTMAAQLRLENVEFLPPVPEAVVPSVLEQMDCLFLSWQRTPLYRFGTSPNKLIDYMMAARPVLQAIDAEIDLVRECGCGMSVPAEDEVAIAQAILAMMAMPAERRHAMGQCGRQYAEKHHDRRQLALRFLEVFEDTPANAAESGYALLSVAEP